MSRGNLVRPILVLALFGILVLALDYGCTPEPEQIRLVPNQPPETVVTGAPLDSSNAFHRYHVFWAGFDADGTITDYFVAVTDSNLVPVLRDFRQTLATDSIIEFTANNEVVLSHSFWVYAVDNEGDRDETPARAFFNSIDTSRPVPVFTETRKTVNGQESPIALLDTIPSAGSSVTLHWTATDADVGGSVTGYRIKLNIDNQFTDIPADSTGVTYGGLPSGNYEFLVEAVDNAGAESLEPASFRWVVNREPDTRVTGMFVSNHDDYYEVPDFREQPPTIRDSSRVTLFFQGNDADGTIVDYAFRTIRCDIERGSCQARPFGSFFPETFASTPDPGTGSADTLSLFYTSNDYFLIVRSRDNEGKADGTPDTVSFMVDFSPVLDEGAVFPGPDEVVSRAGQDSLVVRFRADDVETPAVDLAYRVVLDGRFGAFVTQVADESDLFQRWGFPETGVHTLVYFVEDPGRRADTLQVAFEVVE